MQYFFKKKPSSFNLENAFCSLNKLVLDRLDKFK